MRDRACASVRRAAGGGGTCAGGTGGGFGFGFGGGHHVELHSSGEKERTASASTELFVSDASATGSKPVAGPPVGWTMRLTSSRAYVSGGPGKPVDMYR